MIESPSEKWNLERIGRATIVDQVERQLREKILRREVAPNLKLPSETQMAALFNVSRATVREAVRRLERSGLVYVRHGTRGGVYVREVTFEPVSESLSLMLQLQKISLAELLEARRMVETWAAELAALRASAADIAVLEKTIGDLEAVYLDGREGFSVDAFTDVNMRFHVGIAEAAKNNVLLITMRAVRDLLVDVFKAVGLDYDSTKSVPDIHRTIVAAIRDQNPLVARQRMHEHLLDFENIVLERCSR